MCGSESENADNSEVGRSLVERKNVENTKITNVEGKNTEKIYTEVENGRKLFEKIMAS